MPPDRRQLLKSAAMVAGLTGVAARTLAQDTAATTPGGIVDTQASLFPWPFRRLPHDDPGGLVAKLRSLGIVRAWVGTFEAILHRDLSSVNRHLAAACRDYGEGFLVPFGSVNPALPGWEEDLRQCREEHGMAGIRLLPNYHGYTLDDARFRELLIQASGRGLRVQIAASLEDTRTQHPLVRAADVDLKPLPEAMAAAPGVRVQVLNWKPRGTQPGELEKAPRIWFDCARMEGTDAVARILRTGGRERLMFGTHAPLLIPEAALIRVHESALEPEELRAVLAGNAEVFLA